MIPYAELHAHSAYSFLDGASMPADLVERAVELELSALALTDHDGLPGVVQLASAARRHGLPTVIGSEITVGGRPRPGQKDPDGDHLIVLARGAEGYHALSRTIGEAMLASGEKGHAAHTLESLAAGATDWQILTGCRKGGVRRALEREPGVWAVDAARGYLSTLTALFGAESVAVEITHNNQPYDRERNRLLVSLAKEAGLRVVATGNVHAARASDAVLADVLASTRANRPLEEYRSWLPAWPAYLKSGEQMLALHAEHPGAIAAAAEIGEECSFDLTLVAPDLPPFPTPPGHTEATWLRHLTEQAALSRYGSRQAHPRAWRQIDHELGVIEQLHFPGYFLIVHEIVSFCHEQEIWCQGRGSAANSAVCFALGITAVDAVRHRMLFERFLSPGRSGPPDIDLDIEAGRREEVIQHVYARYGRRHAAQVANVITYRPRSAIRDAARALGYDAGQADAWAKSVERRASDARSRAPELAGSPKRRPGSEPEVKERAPEAEERAPGSQVEGEEITSEAGARFALRWGIESEVPERVVQIAGRLQRLPRHLGIHSGGMVLCDRPVIEVCPVGWARMEGRSVLQWDKDDCAEAGLVKFDLLGLGMLSALRISFTELTERGVRAADGQPLGLHNIDQEDGRVYDLLCAADTIGVFQVESRAQMATLPRIQPRTFYDIVIEVALIRPGPIQGGSVNPYINRRRGREPVTYAHPLLKGALEKTLGVPLFQEQLMQIAIDAAGFTPAQADQLRKAMGAKRSHDRMRDLRGDLMAGMDERGIGPRVREEIYTKLEAFAEFGFPESHSFSFAYLVYASAWLKVHHPENFYAGILAAQPMGFYSPQTLVADARRHGVLVLPVDVCFSEEHSCVEVTPERKVRAHPLVSVDPRRGLRLGLSNIKGLRATERILAARAQRPFDSVADLARRAKLTTPELEKLAAAGALTSLGMTRREGIWAAGALAYTGKRLGDSFQPSLPGLHVGATPPRLPRMSPVEENMAELRSTGISVGTHPMDFLRPSLTERGVVRIADLSRYEPGERIRVAGIVTHRQRPHTASGITFLSLEDESGLLNVVCSVGLWEKHRKVLRTSQGLIIRGVVERADDVMNFVADGVERLELAVPLPSRDFR
ncbi:MULTISPECIES: DNA polymerase III subunit alpha [Trueperella]|uniref:Error-prone DNA polymerase n=1 Tax=Trueperella bernardiae TaxID=59561 RepID=A0A0W1KN50_9ACTO|nr:MULTISPECIES: DNA polymerase III subunit alpha [Trueperella]KTF05065.1 Error-prone DNA polymerase [Trueperella bernardiae]MCM3906669.1 DNA polymerase III subunit alpha [Trueperella bernardiae]MDK8601170.1 DNA polymerase III subunit alpha [Trueperella bernardiae]OCW59841.1 DNA polymerase III subunit alpha [Trueperella bernardiae]OFS68513.1 error-prone DNA polymerase [Trueperella sp. HMSC08H06]